MAFIMKRKFNFPKTVKQSIMKNKKIIFYIFFLLATLSARSQCRFCKTYEDFKAGKWETLDTIYCKSHTKSHKFFVGGNDISLTTEDKATDKMLNKEAFAVKQGRKLFVNCRNMVFQKMRFGKGYAKAMTMGKDSVFFVATKIGRKNVEQQAMAGVVFGAVGAGIAGGSQALQQVCYLVTNEADSRGLYHITMIDDTEMAKIVGRDSKFYKEYLYESDASKRLKPEHIYPILKEAGFFRKIKQGENDAEDQE